LGLELLIVDSIEKIHYIGVHVLVVSGSVIVVFLELPEDFLDLFNGIAIGHHVIEKLEDLFIIDVPFEEVCKLLLGLLARYLSEDFIVNHG
jgi:hypothetical protein